MDYINFDLRLGDWDAGSRTGMVEVLQSPAGESQRRSFVLNIDMKGAASRSDRTSAMAVELGKRLTESLLSQDLLRVWHTSYGIARERERGLRMRLHIDSWELARLPWELLYDSVRGDFLVFDPHASLVRYIRLQAMPPTLHQSPSIKILVVAASPSDLMPLAVEHEIDLIHKALADLIQSGRVELICDRHTTRDSLHHTLLSTSPDVVHYLGHGEYDDRQRIGFLMLENERGLSDSFDATRAARLLRRYGTSLVVLNACETAVGAWAGLAPALIRVDIPAVVAMQWPVEDRAAIRYSSAFYHALALGRTIDECMAEGRTGAHMASSDPNDWAAPVLYLRSSSGHLWTTDIAHIREGTRAIPSTPTRLTRATSGPEDGLAADSFVFKTRGPLHPVHDRAIIIERPELRRALRLAQQPSVTQYIAFLSARQTGKTTLLFSILNRLPSRYVGVYIDLSVLRKQDAPSCYRFLGFSLVSGARDMLGEDFALPETPEIKGPVEFLEFLRVLANAVPMPRIVVLLDEVGALAPDVSDSFFNTLRTVFSRGRGLDPLMSKFLFCFSGAVDLYSLTHGTNSPLNICEKLYLRDLEETDVATIVRQFDGLGVEVAPDVSTAIYRMTGGHPYLSMRLCSLLEREGRQRIAPAEVERMADQMLMEDDHLRHVVYELERRPSERQKLREILIDGRAVPFSRNDPVLASLEMIGAIRPMHPCRVRNALAERTLRQYYAQLETMSERAAPDPDPAQDAEMMYTRLRALREQAIDSATLAYRGGIAWETMAAALFSMVPAFSVFPQAHLDGDHLNLVLAINAHAPGGKQWAIYGNAILVENRNLMQTTPEQVLTELLGRAKLLNLRLVFVMTSGGSGDAKELGRYTWVRGDTCVVPIDDSEIADLLERRGDLDLFLLDKVLRARLRGV